MMCCVEMVNEIGLDIGTVGRVMFGKEVNNFFLSSGSICNLGCIAKIRA